MLYNIYMYGVTLFGRTHKLEHIAHVDKLIDLKNNKDPWEVMDEIVELWQKLRPGEYQSAVIEIEDARNSTYNDYGEAITKGSGSLRRTIDLPLFVERVFRTLYRDTDFEFNKKFYRNIWKRYPIFRVSKRS